MSAIDGAGGGGVGVDCGASVTPMAVSVLELKYDSEPLNVAMIVYLPGTSGVNMKLYMPFAPLVVLPI
jgi:hypothetical protein